MGCEVIWMRVKRGELCEVLAGGVATLKIVRKSYRKSTKMSVAAFTEALPFLFGLI